MSERAPAVLVHGNPETDAVWDPLLAELGRDDVVCLSPPGFGATVGEYRDWLVGELEAFDGPVDLVGHDWGGGHVVNVAMARPDLLRVLIGRSSSSPLRPATSSAKRRGTNRGSVATNKEIP